MFDLGYPSHQYMSTRPGYLGASLQEFYARFPDEWACLDHIFAARYGTCPPCPKCMRPSKWYHIGKLKRLQHPCGFSLHPLGNTIFHKTQIPLQLWFYTMLHFANSAEGVDVPFLSRHLGISYNSSFNLAKRIRLHMASLEYERRIGSAGKAVQVNVINLPNVHRTGARRIAGKLLIVSDGQAVVVTVIARARRHIIRGVLGRWCHPGSTYFTTCYETLRVSSEFGTRAPLLRYSMEKADPHIGWFDAIPSFLSYALRPLRDHHRRIDHSNLWRYLVEAQFRFNRRHRSNQIFTDMISQFNTIRSDDVSIIERSYSHIHNPAWDGLR